MCSSSTRITSSVSRQCVKRYAVQVVPVPCGLSIVDKFVKCSVDCCYIFPDAQLDNLIGGNKTVQEVPVHPVDCRSV